jgi:hypothetical protein
MIPVFFVYNWASLPHLSGAARVAQSDGISHYGKHNPNHWRSGIYRV